MLSLALISLVGGQGLAADSDDDGLDDTEEDLDGDGVMDEGETDPYSMDTDFDFLTDWQERNPPDGIGETDPNDWDSDNDGLSDYFEIYGLCEETTGELVPCGTDPNLADTDGGGRGDGEEVLIDGTDPRAGEASDDLADSDLDGLSNYLEMARDEDGDLERDADGLLTGEYYTDPFDEDTDGDSIEDGIEDANLNGQRDEGETSPIDADTEGDGLDDGWELYLGTDPLDLDSDDD